MIARPLVVGVGDPFRHDDGVGPAVVLGLRGAACDLAVSDGEASRLVDLWQGRTSVVLVDAVRGREPAGTVLVLRSNDIVSVPMHSTHGGGVAEAIGLARALGRLPDDLWIVGVVGSDFGLGPGLSAPVSGAVGEAGAAVQRLLAGMRVS